MNERCADWYEGFETLVGFAWAHRYPSAFLQFAKLVFDQVPPFVGLLVELWWELPVGFRRYDRGYAAILQIITQPTRVKSPVRQQMPSGQAADQCIGLAQIVGLPWHQTEIDDTAERRHPARASRHSRNAVQ
ncbi:MAG: hypothetical protein RIG84_12155 [Roseovarius sp.]